MSNFVMKLPYPSDPYDLLVSIQNAEVSYLILCHEAAVALSHLH
jgi:hypothetical protein